MAKIVRSEKAVILLITNGLVYAIGILMPVILVRYLSKTDYGIYSQTFMVGRIVYAAFLFGIIPSIYHFYPLLQGEKRERFLNQSVGILISLGILAALFLLSISGLLGKEFHNPELPQMLRIYALYMAFILASDYFIPLLIAQGNYSRSLVVSVLENTVKLVFLCLPMVFGYNVQFIMMSLAAFAGVRCLVYFSMSQFRDVRSKISLGLDRAMLREQFRFATPLGLTYIVGLISGSVDKIVISSYLTPTDFALYSIGAIGNPLAGMIQGSVMTVLRTELPRLVADNNYAEAIKIWSESVRKPALMILPFFAYSIINAKDLIVFFYTAKYLNSVPVFIIYLFFMPLTIANFSVIPLVFEKTRFQLYMSFFGLVLMTALSVTLLPVMGMNGPALCMVLASIITSSMFLIYSARLLKTTVFILFPWLKVGNIMLASFAAGLVARFALHGVLRSGLVYLMISGLAFGALYIWTIYQFRILTAWDKELLSKWTVKTLQKIGLR